MVRNKEGTGVLYTLWMCPGLNTRAWLHPFQPGLPGGCERTQEPQRSLLWLNGWCPSLFGLVNIQSTLGHFKYRWTWIIFLLEFSLFDQHEYSSSTEYVRNWLFTTIKWWQRPTHLGGASPQPQGVFGKSALHVAEAIAEIYRTSSWTYGNGCFYSRTAPMF